MSKTTFFNEKITRKTVFSNKNVDFLDFFQEIFA